MTNLKLFLHWIGFHNGRKVQTRIVNGMWIDEFTCFECGHAWTRRQGIA